MVSKHIKRYLISLVIKELQIETMIYPAEWLKLKILTISNVYEDVEKLELSHTLLMGLSNGTTNLKNSLEIS